MLFKRIVLKKWIVPKEGIAVAWSGHTHGAPSDYRCNSYIGFLLLNGDLIKIPMMQIGNDKFTDPKYQLGARKLYRGGLIWYHKNVDFTDGPRYLGIIPRERVI